MTQRSASSPSQGPQGPQDDQGSTADLLASYVHAVGVRHVFGYPGESVIDFMEAARLRDEMFTLQKRLKEMKA